MFRLWVSEGFPEVGDEVMLISHISESPAGIVAENVELQTPNSLGGMMLAYVCVGVGFCKVLASVNVQAAPGTVTNEPLPPCR